MQFVSRGNEDWGHSAILSWYPQQHILIIVATNSGFENDTPKSRILSEKITKVLLSK
jgi:hypothetical protein